MSNDHDLPPLTPEQEAHYTRLARLQYDLVIVNQSIRLWNDYSQFEKDLIIEQGTQIHRAIAAAIDQGKSAQSTEVQELIGQWEAHLHYFYTPTLEILRGLGDLYSADPAFAANFRKIHPHLPEFLSAAISGYVDDLEEAELIRLLAEDEAKKSGAGNNPTQLKTLPPADAK